MHRWLVHAVRNLLILTFLFVCPVEFSVLVDVTSEKSCQISAMGEDNISSLYQYTISSANTQPTDRGECTYFHL